MARSRRQAQALKALNYDLFRPESLNPPAPATLYGTCEQAKRRAQTQAARLVPQVLPILDEEGLPTIDELRRRFDRFNWLYFDGKLPRMTIEYSTRMSCAGSYTPQRRLIRLGRKYHRLFPDDIDDTLKHEMIHILHFRHNAAFKAEARRIGASVRARAHPSLRRPPRYLYRCGGCGREYPRQKRLRMASCGQCSKGGRYDPRFKLRLVDSPGLRRRPD